MCRNDYGTAFRRRVGVLGSFVRREHAKGRRRRWRLSSASTFRIRIVAGCHPRGGVECKLVWCQLRRASGGKCGRRVVGSAWDDEPEGPHGRNGYLHHALAFKS